MDNNLSVLVDAKKEYTDQLISLMAPVMIDVFHQMFQEATTLSKNKKVLQMFQKLLKEVPNWSNAMSKQHSDRIENKCSWFGDLLAAVFVSHVKILSAVRLQSGNKKLSLKLPTNEVFVQTVYNNAARELYNDPYIFTESQSEYIRDKELFKRFSEVIESTVKEMIPVQHILQTYMNQTAGDGFDMEDAEPIDDDDVEQYNEPQPTEEGVETQGEGEAPPAGQEIEEGYTPPEQNIGPIATEPETKPEFREFPRAESSVPIDHEVGVKDIKTISTQEEDQNLFDDAPEERRKKLSYM